MPLFETPFCRIVNPLIAREPWAQQRIVKHAGKNLTLSLSPFFLTLSVNHHGEFIPAPSQAVADVTITVLPERLVSAFQDPQSLVAATRIEGDAGLAQTIGELAQHLRWDIEGDLAEKVGPVWAHRIMSVVRVLALSLPRQVGKSAWRFAENTAEYLLYENPQLVTPLALQNFTQEVRAIRDHAERLAKRLNQLENSMTKN